MLGFTRLFLLSLLCALLLIVKSNSILLETINDGSGLAHEVNSTKLKILDQYMHYLPGFVSNSTLDIMRRLLNQGELRPFNSEDLNEVRSWHVRREKRSLRNHQEGSTSQLGTSDNDKCCPTLVNFYIVQGT